MREPRYFSAGAIPVNDVSLRGLHQFWLGARQRFPGGVAIPALDRFFNAADRAAHLGASCLVDHAAAGNLSCRLLGGTGIGHLLDYPSTGPVACIVELERASGSTRTR